jgi:CheY-like chemotaxis protein
MQVLLNLLDNAIKVTPAGSVKLAVSHGDAPEGGLPGGHCLLRFSVTDSGIGISEEAQGRLFCAFTQADGSITRRFGGTGLGLAVSKQLCEMMGGSIGLHSAPDRGSTFWFTICAEAIDRTPALSVAPSACARPVAGLAETIPPRPESGPRVLIAEDSPVIAEIARAILKAAGCRVTFAVNGRLAVDAWRRESFDLVLMDCQMPECDGFDATREIRSLEAGSAAHVPIVALTANTMEGDRERCMAAGMDDYLSKPFNRSELQALVARWVVPADAAATGGVPPSGRPAAG